MLEGKTVVITGSTSGIGLGMARVFAEAGANIMLNGFGSPEDIARLRDELAATVRVAYHPADVSQPDEVAALVAAAEEAFGAIDILVNNAGLQHVAPVDEFPIEKWNLLRAVILDGAFHATRATLPGMKRRGWGRIINLVSAHGLVASPFKSAYVAAKHGVIGLTRTVALEVAEAGITCNAICPGYVDTPLVEAQIAHQAAVHGLPAERVIREVILASQPTKRFVTIEEVSALALFLCGDSARSINGAAIPIDGGWTAR